LLFGETGEEEVAVVVGGRQLGEVPSDALPRLLLGGLVELLDELVSGVFLHGEACTLLNYSRASVRKSLSSSRFRSVSINLVLVLKMF
jgi:hypothetical protein